MDNQGLNSEKNLFQRPVKNNGFMNFMRQFVKHSPPTPDLDGVRQVWNLMSEKEKEKFREIDEGFFSPSSPSCPPPKKKSSCQLAKKLKKQSCRKPKKRCAAKPRRPKCSKPKPRKRKPQCRLRPKPRPRRPKPKCNALATLPNNGYLNFLRAYRRKHWNMKPNDLVMKAARAWCRMPELKKEGYRRRVRVLK